MCDFILSKFDKDDVQKWFWNSDIKFWKHGFGSKRKICELVHVLDGTAINIVIQFLEKWDGPLNSFAYYEIRKKLCEFYK